MPSGSSKFIARLLDGEAMSEVCRTFGISRKTGYKIFERYRNMVLRLDRPLAPAGSLRQPAAATDRERDRRGQARQAALGLPEQVVARLIA
jgi:transposase-like protein